MIVAEVRVSALKGLEKLPSRSYIIYLFIPAIFTYELVTLV